MVSAPGFDPSYVVSITTRPATRNIGSIGESTRLITARFKVQVLDVPPKGNLLNRGKINGKREADTNRSKG